MVLYRYWMGIDIFALDYYVKDEKNETGSFSHRLTKFKFKGTYLDLFLERLEEFFQKHVDVGVDAIAVMPRSDKGSEPREGVTEMMRRLSQKQNVGCFSLLRTRDVKPQHKCAGFQERCENVKNSLGVPAGVHGKTVMIFDDANASGASLCEAARVLRENGAKAVFAVVLGINKSKEADKFKEEYAVLRDGQKISEVMKHA